MVHSVARRGFPACSLLAYLAGACLHAPRVGPPGPPRTSHAPETRAVPATRASAATDAGFPLSWQPGETLLQGYVGAKYLADFSVDRGASSVELDEDEYEILPVIGGGAQLKLFGDGFDFGIEGLLSFSGRADLEAFASSGGVAVAAFDVNLLVFEAYGGPFVSRFIGDRLRLYAAGGPLLLWAGYDQSDDEIDEDADGSGGGVYARGGFELLMPSGNLVGLGVKWSEASVDLSDELGDLELEGVEVYVTYAYGLRPRSPLELEGW